MSEVELFPGYVSRLGLGVIPREELARHSGLVLLRRLIAGEYTAPPMAGTLNFGLTEVDHGRAVFRGVPNERHLNPLGAVHGGWAATIMDSALGCAVHTTMVIGEAYTTAEFKVNLLRPPGEVVCESRVVHRGRTLAVSDRRRFSRCSDDRLLLRVP